MFNDRMRDAVTRVNHCFRAYLKMTTCNGEELYIRSHNDIPTPDALTTTAGVASLSSFSQGVDFETSRTSIGGFNFRLLDFDRTFAQWMRDLQACSLSKTKVQYFAGYQFLCLEDYHCVQTAQLSRMSFKNKGYDFEAQDPTRIGRKKIFPRTCGRVVGNVYNTVRDRNRDGDPEGLLNEDGTFDLLDTEISSTPITTEVADTYGYLHLEADTYFVDDDSENIQQEILVKVDCEVMRLVYVSEKEYPALFNAAEERTQARVVVRRYRITARSVERTQGLNIPENGLIIRDDKEICRANVLKGKATDIMYQIMTGYSLETGELVANQFDHAQIPREIIKTETFENPIFNSSELEFIAPDEIDAKAFWEDQILRWLDAYLIVDGKGNLCLVPHDEPSEDQNAREITDNEIIRCSDIEEDTNVTTGYYMSWDKDSCSNNFLSNSPVEIGSGDLAIDCLERKIEICRFEGVRTNFQTATAVRNRACRWLSNRASPKWSMSVTLCIDYGDIVPGDKLRVTSDQITNHQDPELKFSRVFEVRDVEANFAEGIVEVQLQTRAKPASERVYSGCIDSFSACARGHCDGRTVLPIIGNTIPAGTVLDLPAGEYCFVGDLIVDGTIRQSTPGTLGLAITGTLSGAGTITTKGQGLGGRAGTTSIRSSTVTGIGSGDNNSQGGAFGRCQEDQQPGGTL